MPIVEFGNFEPDKVDSSTSVNTATNVFPAAVGYKKVPGFAMFSQGISESPLGAISVKDKDRNTFNFVGTETKLFQLSSGSDFVDASDTNFSTAGDDYWEFVQWKEKVIATNFSDSRRSPGRPDPPFFGATAPAGLDSESRRALLSDPPRGGVMEFL